MSKNKVFLTIATDFFDGQRSLGLVLKKEGSWYLAKEEVRIKTNFSNETYFLPHWTGELDLTSMKALKIFVDKAINILENKQTEEEESHGKS